MTRRWLATAVVLVVAALYGGDSPAQSDYYFFGKNKVIYGKFDWRVYHAPHLP